MNLRRPKGSKEWRMAMHASYEAYARGEVNYPRIFVGGSRREEIESLPRKTQPIALALFKTWEQIRAGQESHKGLIEFHRRNSAEILSRGEEGRAMAVSEIGNNALALSLFIPAEGEVEEHHLTIGPRKVREEFLETFDLLLADGRVVKEGGLAGTPTPDLQVLLPYNLRGDIGSRIMHWDAMPPQTPQPPQQQAA